MAHFISRLLGMGAGEWAERNAIKDGYSQEEARLVGRHVKIVVAVTVGIVTADVGGVAATVAESIAESTLDAGVDAVGDLQSGSPPATDLHFSGHERPQPQLVAAPPAPSDAPPVQLVKLDTEPVQQAIKPATPPYQANSHLRWGGLKKF